MPKLVPLLLLGICVVAVHMAPVDNGIEQLLDLVYTYGPQVEKKLQETDPSFNWERWWVQYKPAMRALTKIVRPDPENAYFCREDDEAFVDSNGQEIEKEVQNTDTTFSWSSWWSQAKHILKVIGDFVDPLAQKPYCNVNGLVIAGETIPASKYSIHDQLEKIMKVIDSYGPQAEKEIQKTEPSFNWNSWWSQSKPVMMAMNFVLPPDPAYRTNLCREDEEKFVNSHGQLIEKEVQKTNPSFNWDRWWGPARYYLEVVGPLVNPIAEKPRCNSTDKKDVEQLQALWTAYKSLREMKELQILHAIVNAHGPQIEREIKKTNPSFSWDSWWSQASPILKVIKQIVKPLHETKDTHCKKDGDEQKNEEHVNSYGPEVEKEIQKRNQGFDWKSWWNEAKPVLRVIGNVVRPIARTAKTYCKDDDAKPKTV